MVFTAMDDNSIGAAINGSTGTPTNYYANPALGISIPSVSPVIKYFRIAYAKQAVSLNSASHPDIFYHGQILNCQNGFTINSGTTSQLRNVLFSSVQTNFNNLNEASLDVQNSTFSSSSNLTAVYTGSQQSTASFTNCLLVNVANLTNNLSLGSLTYQLNGNYNGVYNSPNVGSVQFTNSFCPFQTAGAGTFYLTNGCNFLNVGTTNIDPALLADLGSKTTYPPLLLSNITVSVNTTLNPQAQRESSSPSLGYHYDPIDYIVDSYAVTNCVLTIGNGTAIAADNNVGVEMLSGSSIVSIGTPVTPNWFVSWQCAQEQPMSSSGVSVIPEPSTIPPNGQFQFTKFAYPAGSGQPLYDASTLLV